MQNRCPGRVTFPAVAMHPSWNREHNQSYPGYVTHIDRGLGHTQIAKGEYCNVVPDHCIDHKTFESISTIFKAYSLDQQAFW